MNGPLCPRCGSTMVIRTARRGPNAGGQFYSCSRFPACRGTRPIDLEDSSLPNREATPPAESSETSFPRALVAQSKRKGKQVRFFEAVGVPFGALEKLFDGSINDAQRRAFAQWRLDAPLSTAPLVLAERTRQVLAVAEKILTRGRITVCSPRLEERLGQALLPGPIDWDRVSLVPQDLTIPVPLPGENPECLESQEEETLYRSFFGLILGQTCAQCVLPQVGIVSLVPSSHKASGGRVDFVVAHPSLNEAIVVEVDGPQHQAHAEADENRDKELRESGYDVVRIPTSEVGQLRGPNLRHLAQLLEPVRQQPSMALHSHAVVKFVHAIRLAHQIQLALLQAIKTGYLDVEESSSWKVYSDIDSLGIFQEQESQLILREAVEDLVEMLQNLSALYSVDLFKGLPECSTSIPELGSSGVVVSFSGFSNTNLPVFEVQPIYVPFHISNEAYPSTGAVLDPPDVNRVEYFLRYLFRKQNLWEGQYDAISRALQARDAIVLLPTGAGKSIAFQLASMLLPGRTIVIEPIISLIEDQVDNLASYAIDRCVGITSQIDSSEERAKVMHLLGQGEYLFAYVAPERLQMVEFRDALRALTVHTPIAVIVVDEAHCVSEWGHDFRTSYLNIGRTTRQFCESNGYIPPLLALTGTASRAVLKDVQRELQIEDFDAIITPKSFDRKELKFSVIRCNSAEKFTRLKGYLGQMLPSLFSTSFATFYQPRGRNTYSGLIFCPWVNGEFGVVRVSEQVQSELGIPNSFYSGSAPKHWSDSQWSKRKRSIARQFKHNAVPLLACTKAFGMGIDKPNIRYTIHYGLPGSIESFYQEAGRAGRDRSTAHCCIIVSVDDPERTAKLLNPATPVEEVADVIKSISWDDNDDITRALFFHTRAFRGIPRELEDVAVVLERLGDYSKKSHLVVPVPQFSDEKGDDMADDDSLHRAEKAIHRLLVLGVVSDYTINYSAKEFTISLSGASKESIIESYGRYVSSYSGGRGRYEVRKASQYVDLPLTQFVPKMVELLLRFIYEVIEQGRRRALYEMFLTATSENSDKGIRQRILQYLETTQHSKLLEELLQAPAAGVERIREVFDQVVCSPNDASELRGQVARYLESYPDHPGLLMLRSLSETFTRDWASDVVKQNFVAAISSAERNYGMDPTTLYEFAAWGIQQVARRDIGLAEVIENELLLRSSDPALARTLIRHVPPELAVSPAWFLIRRLTERVSALIPDGKEVAG